MSEMMNNKKAHAKKDFRADPSARKSFVLLIDHSKYRSLIEDRYRESLRKMNSVNLGYAVRYITAAPDCSIITLFRF